MSSGSSFAPGRSLFAIRRKNPFFSSGSGACASSGDVSCAATSGASVAVDSGFSVSGETSLVFGSFFSSSSRASAKSVNLPKENRSRRETSLGSSIVGSTRLVSLSRLNSCESDQEVSSPLWSAEMLSSPGTFLGGIFLFLKVSLASLYRNCMAIYQRFIGPCGKICSEELLTFGLTFFTHFIRA